MPHLDVFVHSCLLDEELESLDPETYKRRLQQFKWIQDYTRQIDEELTIQLYNLSEIANHLKNIMDVVTQFCETADYLSTIRENFESNIDTSGTPDIHAICKRLSGLRNEQFKRKLRFE